MIATYTKTELANALATFVERDEVGRHFTTIYPNDLIEALEAEGLIDVARPVYDDGTPSIPEYWHAEPTDQASDFVARWVD